MDIEAIRQYCLALPATTEKIQWGADLVFKVGGKMYAAVVLDDRKLGQLSFKSTPEGFADLVEREGIEPAAYAARYHWVTVLPPHTLREEELRTLLRAAYEIVRAALPRKVQARIAGDAGASPPRTKPRRKSRH
ncbi:MAG TPA: MmcQ/YjbR family DNA-binding protein [Candidatus Acidoferrales bacterium]|nr:MmcQ/YjbR family DNA-binding protein [Candidatus Acidoferrales bacterium]